MTDFYFVDSLIYSLPNGVDCNLFTDSVVFGAFKPEFDESTKYIKEFCTLGVNKSVVISLKHIIMCPIFITAQELFNNFRLKRRNE